MNYLNHKITHEESLAINTLRLLCIISVVMIHSNVFKYTPNELLPSIKIIHNLFIVLPNLEILFMLSGFLFFYNIDVEENFRETYVKKIKKRITGLFIPYLIWNTIGLLVGLYIKPSADIHVESLSDIFLGYWPLDPMGHPFGRAIWFIRNLIFFSLISPLYFYLIKYLKHFFLIIVIVTWYVNIPVDYLYFNTYLLLGAYLGYYKVSIYEIISKINWKLYLLCFIPLLYVHSLYESNIIITIIYVLWSFCTFLSISMKCPINYNISSLGMFIYVSHLYINYGITNAIISHFEKNLLSLSLTMLTSCIITISICIIAYKILKRFTPKMLNILIGGR